MLPVPNIENFNQQMNSFQSQLAQLKAPQYIPSPAPMQPPTHEPAYVTKKDLDNFEARIIELLSAQKGER